MTERDAIAFLKGMGYRVSKPRPSNRARRHQHCAEHATVDGYREPVCVLNGQDRAEVIAFAVEVAALARSHRAYAIAA